MTFEELARDLYEFYLKESDGISATGVALPVWEEFRSDPHHVKQYRAWLMTASRATSLLLGPKVFEKLSENNPTNK